MAYKIFECNEISGVKKNGMNYLTATLTALTLGVAVVSAHDEPRKRGFGDGIRSVGKGFVNGLREGGNQIKIGIRDLRRSIRGADPYDSSRSYGGTERAPLGVERAPLGSERYSTARYSGESLWKKYERELEMRRAYEREHGIVHNPDPPAPPRPEFQERPKRQPSTRLYGPTPHYQPNSGLRPRPKKEAATETEKPAEELKPEIVAPKKETPPKREAARPEPKPEPKPRVRPFSQFKPRTEPKVNPKPNATANSAPSSTRPKPTPGKPDYPTATKTDNPGIVTSPYPPYDPLDVTGLKSGSLAKDPLTGNIFRVP